MSRLVLANLHGEALLAEASSGREQSLPPTLLQRLSATGTLLRVFCTPADRLWTPLPVDPACLAVVPGCEAPTLVHGAPPSPLPGEQLVPWMASPLGECIAASAVEVAREVCHRSYALALSARLGLAIPGARMISSALELEQHLRDGGARAAPDGRWVLKPPLSAAGRGQLLAPHAAAWDSAPWRDRVAVALERHGAMLFEPWLERVHDLGSCGEVVGGEVKILGLHGLVVGPTGHFSGVVVAPAGVEAIPGLSPAVAQELAEVTRQVGEALAASGHQGPFGVDAFTHAQAHGEVALRPLCEINARLTFGRVAAEWLRLVAPEASGPARLLFARGPLAEAVEQRRGALAAWSGAAASALSQARVIPLLSPDPSHGRGGTVAWLEVASD